MTQNSAFGPHFQRAILHYMMKEVRFSQKAVAFLKEDFFTAELKWFFRKIKEHTRDHKKLMSFTELGHEVAKQGVGKEAQVFEDERAKIIAQPDYSLEYLKKNMTTFIRCNIFISGVSDAASLFNTGSTQSAFEFTEKRLAELRRVDFEDSQVTEFGDHEQVCDALAQQKQEAVPTGIHHIDEAMGGGLMPQTWTTFLGGSNVGKSMLCPNLAYYAALKGRKTFVLIHEDEMQPTKARYLSRFSGYTYNELVTPRFRWPAEMAQKVKQADDFLQKHVKMRFMYGADCLIERVDEAASLQMMDDPFHLLLDDYGQCLKSQMYKSMEDRYGLHEYIYDQLKQICLRLNVAGAGGAQANRAGHKHARSGADLLRGTDIGDSWGIFKKASNVITMNRSVEDVEQNRITFLLDKVRNGSKCPIAVQCVTDFSRCTTHLPWGETDKNQMEVPVSDGKKEAARRQVD